MKITHLLASIIMGSILLAGTGCVENMPKDENRIEFAKNATEALVTGQLENFQSKQSYLINVKAGQTMTVDQVLPDGDLRYVTVTLDDPSGADVSDMDASCNNHKQVSPTVAGDYTIHVAECQKADPWNGTFTLKVKVE